MTAPNIPNFAGMGGAFAISGTLLVGASAAVGLSAAVPAIPLWASFLVIGLPILSLGFVLLNRRKPAVQMIEKPIEKPEMVAKELSITSLVKDYPLVAVAGVAAAGYVVASALRGRRAIEVAIQPVTGDAAPSPVTGRSLFDTLAEQIAPLAAIAASTVADMGMKAMGVNDPAELLAKLLGNVTKAAAPKEERLPENGHHANGRIKV